MIDLSLFELITSWLWFITCLFTFVSTKFRLTIIRTLFVMLLIEVRMDVEPVSINVDIVQLITRQILLNLEMEEWWIAWR